MTKTFAEFITWLQENPTAKVFVATDVWEANGKPDCVEHCQWLEPGTIVGMLPPPEWGPLGMLPPPEWGPRGKPWHELQLHSDDVPVYRSPILEPALHLQKLLDCVYERIAEKKCPTRSPDASKTTLRSS